MEHINMQTPDGAQLNLDALYKICPSCFTEAAAEDGSLKRVVDFKKLRALLGDDAEDDAPEAYDFTWVGKRAAQREAAAPINKTLRPCPEESVDWDTTQNLYIEGDNLEVLKLLQNSYMGKVKMIYIDPPYNTGNDFVYHDDFAQSADEYDEHNINENGERFRKNTDSNGRFHSDWCSMIYARLMVGRTLLREDGVILINMDENEITNLQKICNEIFGEYNDLGTIIWDKRNPKGDARGISYQHENILVYAKNAYILTSNCKIQRPKKNANLMIKKAKQLFSKVSGDYSLEQVNVDYTNWLSKQDGLSGGEKAYNRIDDKGRVYQSVSMGWPNKKQAPEDYFIPLIHPITGKPCPVPERGWRTPPSTMKQLIEQDMIIFGKDESTQPRRKYLLEENMYENIPSLLYYGGSDVDLLNKLDIPFDTPKVVSICMEHIRSFTNPGDIILDFFSGSATNAHAVMQLNAEESQNRHFILVQIPEEIEKKSVAYNKGYRNLCEMGKERIRRSRKMIKADVSNVDTGFRVFKCDSSNMKDVYFAPKDYDQQMLFDLEDNIKEDRTDLDLLFDCMLRWGVELSLPLSSKKVGACTIHNVNDGDLVACFDGKITDEVIDAIAEMNPLRVVFRDSSFTEASQKMNLFELFKQKCGWTDAEVRNNVKVI